MSVWRVSVDTGGTFTDCLAIDPDGRRRRVKVLSSSCVRYAVRASRGQSLELESAAPLPDGLFQDYRVRALSTDHERDQGCVTVAGSTPGGVLRLDRSLGTTTSGIEIVSPEEPPVLALRLLTGKALSEPLPPVELRVATTRGTNALLEGRGVAPVLFVNVGFEDLLLIGDQARPDLFALDIDRPSPLYREVIGITGRLDAAGCEQSPLDLDALRRTALDSLEQGATTAAVALLHSYLNPRHESAVAELLTSLGYRYVASSAELAPRIKVLARAQTAVVDAYLAPVISSFVKSVADVLPRSSSLRVMTSSGGLSDASAFRAKDSLLSGPAGGVVGAASSARSVGWSRALGFDMGGTSTDVSRYDNGFEYLTEHDIGGARVFSPALAIETVAAGGGSICWVDRGEPRVGPRSAGAQPGPACYGAGGPLTVTDVNLLLGRLDESRFGVPLSVDAARSRFDQLAAELSGVEEDQLLSGLLQIANEKMAAAIRRISLQRGYDPREYGLVAFGGAGPQHACAVADLLGVTRILAPADASLLSAYGLERAALERISERQVLSPLDPIVESGKLAQIVRELEEDARNLLLRSGAEARSCRRERCILRARLLGQESTLTLDWAEEASPTELFDAAYERTYGYARAAREIELESVQVVMASRVEGAGPTESPEGVAGPGLEERSSRALFGAQWREVPLVQREALGSSERRHGPALITEPHSLIVVEPGWTARRSPCGGVLVERADASDA